MLSMYKFIGYNKMKYNFIFSCGGLSIKLDPKESSFSCFMFILTNNNFQ